VEWLDVVHLKIRLCTTSRTLAINPDPVGSDRRPMTAAGGAKEWHLALETVLDGSKE